MIFNMLLILMALIIGISLYASKVILYPKTRDFESVWHMECERMPELGDFFETHEVRSIEMATQDHMSLMGWLCEATDAKGIVIVVHGIRMNRYSSVKYMKLFHDMGYHVVAYDQQNHGESDGEYTTYGMLEKAHLSDVITWVRANLSSVLPLYTHGESLGAATVILNAADDLRVQGVIADCGFSSAERIFSERMWAEMHVPKYPFLPLASAINWLKTGYWYKDMNPEAVMSTFETPILILHGDYDRYVPFDHAERLYRAGQGRKMHKLWLVAIANAGHAKALVTAPDAYREACERFFSEL